MKTSENLWCILLSLLQFLHTYKTCAVKIGCDFNKELGMLKCHGVLSTTPNNINTTILEICEFNENTLNLNQILEQLPNLINITINNGSVNSISDVTTSSNKLKTLHLLRLKIKQFEPKILAFFPNLELLDLRENYLRDFNYTTNSSAALRKLYLAGNHWNCSLNLDWILHLNKSLVVDLNNLTCYGSPYPGKKLLPIAELIRNITIQCPARCNCSMPNVVTDPKSKNLEPIVEVNCTERSLEVFPIRIPLYTKILRLENNDIDDLSALLRNPYYRSVLDLYLDNNRISSIEILEGSHWLNHFRIFSLSGNKLTQLPTYALDNALQRNPNMPNAVMLYLGDNPWRCDCVFTPGFQEMLQKYQPQIEDIDEIKCSYVEGDDNSLSPILKLTRSSVCHLPSEYSVRALDLVNGILASLIVLVLGKLVYDYYYFKRTGKLPWIVTKMP